MIHAAGQVQRWETVDLGHKHNRSRVLLTPLPVISLSIYTASNQK